MSVELIVASVAITCALVLYTVGVFGSAARAHCPCVMCFCFGAVLRATPPGR